MRLGTRALLRDRLAVALDLSSSSILTSKSTAIESSLKPSSTLDSSCSSASIFLELQAITIPVSSSLSSRVELQQWLQ